MRESQLVQDLYMEKLRMFGPVLDAINTPTDRRVSTKDFYSMMNGGSTVLYQQKQPKRPKTPQEAEMEIEHLKQYGPAYIGAVGGNVAGLSYALSGGATAASTLALGLAGAALGALVLGGLGGLGAYYLFFRGRRKGDPRHPILRRRSVLYWLLDWLKDEWEKGSR